MFVDRVSRGRRAKKKELMLSIALAVRSHGLSGNTLCFFAQNSNPILYTPTPARKFI